MERGKDEKMDTGFMRCQIRYIYIYIIFFVSEFSEIGYSGVTFWHLVEEGNAKITNRTLLLSLFSITCSLFNILRQLR